MNTVRTVRTSPTIPASPTIPTIPTIRTIGAILTYPDAGLMAALPDIRQQAMWDPDLPMRAREALVRVIEEMAGHDVYQLQQDYVACFDRGRATSLHLFEHVHGDSRERGPAMIDLREQYLQAGLALNPGELPDYLPAFLEYLAHLPAPAARVQLGSIVHILHSIHGALLRNRSLYAAALAALLALAGEKVETAAPLRKAAASPPRPASSAVPGSTVSPATPASSAPPAPSAPPEAAEAAEAAASPEVVQSAFDDLDAEWAEQPAFGPAQPGACRPHAGGSTQALVFMPTAGRSEAQAHRGVTP